MTLVRSSGGLGCEKLGERIFVRSICSSRRNGDRILFQQTEWGQSFVVNKRVCLDVDIQGSLVWSPALKCILKIIMAGVHFWAPVEHMSANQRENIPGILFLFTILFSRWLKSWTLLIGIKLLRYISVISQVTLGSLESFKNGDTLLSQQIFLMNSRVGYMEW